MNCIKKAFGSRLKSLRKSRNLTQEQLAEQIGINIRQLARIEVGESFITADTLYNICKILEISPSLLFDFEIDNKMHLNVLDEVDNDSLYNNYQLLKEKILTIDKNKAKLEFMNVAFDSLTSRDALEQLKLFHKLNNVYLQFYQLLHKLVQQQHLLLQYVS